MNFWWARADIYRLTQQADDDYGGAVYSGTVVYPNTSCQFEVTPSSRMLLQQGIEVQSIAFALVRPATLQILEQDQFEITWPPYHPQYGKRYKIDKVEADARPASKAESMLRLTLKRIDSTRNQQ